MTEPDKVSLKAIYAQELLMRANQSNSKTDADSAVREWEALASLVSRDHASYEPILASYSVALLLRWELGHSTNDLRRAIVMLEKALGSLPDTASKNRYQNLANLGSAYMDRYETTREDRRDLLRAIDTWEEAYSMSKRLNLVNQAVSHIYAGSLSSILTTMSSPPRYCPTWPPPTFTHTEMALSV
jgi:tetratricopeptide (TPR) repeat protein